MNLDFQSVGDAVSAESFIYERIMQYAATIEGQLAKSLEMVGHLMRTYKDVKDYCAAQSLELYQLKCKEQSFCGNQFYQLQHVLAKLKQKEEENSSFCDRILELELSSERLQKENMKYYKAANSFSDSEEQLQQLSQYNYGLERQNAKLHAEMYEMKEQFYELKNLQVRVYEISRENSVLYVYTAAKENRSCLVPQDIRCIFAVQKPFNQFIVTRLLEKSYNTDVGEPCSEEVQNAFEIVEHATFAQLHHAISARYDKLGLLEKQILRDAGIFP